MDKYNFREACKKAEAIESLRKEVNNLHKELARLANLAARRECQNCKYYNKQ